MRINFLGSLGVGNGLTCEQFPTCGLTDTAFSETGQ